MNDLSSDLVRLLRRFREELEYSDAKGSGPYREGMHDGLHFATDALADVLQAHGLSGAEPQTTTASAEIPREYGV